MRYDAYIFDLDGTIYLGDALLPGAAEAVARIRAAGRRTLFLSNNPTHTRQAYARRLTALGIPTGEGDIVNSSLVMREWLLGEAPGAPVFVIGEEPLREELRQAGVPLSEEPGRVRFVVASFDRTFDYRKLQVAFDCVRAGARLVATNGDRYCPVPGGGQPDAAAVIAAVEACTGARCDPIVGKPSPIMVSALRGRLGVPAERCVVTGDRLETDVAMGRAAGMAAALVLTGATAREDLAASPIQPDYVLESLLELP